MNERSDPSEPSPDVGPSGSDPLDPGEVNEDVTLRGTPPRPDDSAAAMDGPTLQPGAIPSPFPSAAGEVSKEVGNGQDDEALDAPTLRPVGNQDTPVAYEDAATFDGFFGDYELLGEIARGGMGVVYKAKHKRLNRVVALKMILAGQLACEDEVHRFQAEAESAANLDHPGIVPIYEVGQHRGQHYFTMAFVDGESLADLIVEKPWDPNEAAALAIRICQAIGYAHEQGVIHRDLKPANILVQETLVTSDTPRGESWSFSSTVSYGASQATSRFAPRITDFGLAKRVQGEDQLTQTGQVLGTPSYMPPEQAAGKIDEIDERSDVYSIGGIVYAMLTGRPPFQAASHLDTLMQVLEKDPLPPHHLNPGVPRDLETIALKALEKDPKRRYQSSSEMGDDLSRFLCGEPIRARSVTRLERVWRWSKRHPAIAALSSLVLVLAATVMIAGPTMAYRETILRNQAEQKTEAAETAQSIAEAAVKQEVASRREAEQARQELAEEKFSAERRLYARTIALAYQEWLRSNVQRAEDLIDKTDYRFRDWEWHFVKSLCHAEAASLFGHLGIPQQIRLTQDGDRLVSVGLADGRLSDHHVYLWDLSREKLLRRVPFQCYAISDDGEWIFGRADARSPLEIRNAESQEVFHTLSFDDIEITSAQLHPTLSWVTCLTDDGVAYVWNYETDKLVVDWEMEGEELVAVQMVDGGSIGPPALIGLTKRGGILEFQFGASESQRRVAVVAPPSSSAFLRVSNSGALVAAVSNQYIYVVDRLSGRRQATLAGHMGAVLDAAFTKEGNQIVSCGVDATVRVWDVDVGIEVNCLRGHKSGLTFGVHSVCISPDGEAIFSGGADSLIKRWDFPTLTSVIAGVTRGAPPASQECNWLAVDSEVIEDLDFSPHEDVVASIGEDGSVSIINASTLRVIRQWNAPITKLHCVALHPTKSWIACGSGGRFSTEPGSIFVWDYQSGELIQELKGHTAPIADLVFARNEPTLYSCSGSEAIVHRGELFAWDLDTGATRFELDAKSGTVDLAIDSKGENLAVCTYQHPIKIVDARSGRVIREVGLPGDVYLTAEFTPDASALVVGCFNWAVAKFDLESGDRVWEQIEHSGAVTGLSLNPSGTRICTSSVDHTAKLWDVESGALLLDFVSAGHSQMGTSFSADGKALASFGMAPYAGIRRIPSETTSSLNASPASDWPILFSEDFAGSSMGERWDIVSGNWSVSGGEAQANMSPQPLTVGLGHAEIVATSGWLPSHVSVAMDVRAPKGMVFHVQLMNRSRDTGAESLFIGENVAEFNQGRRGAAVIMRVPGGQNQIARLDNRVWFEPNRTYRLMTLRQGSQWQLWIDGQPILESRIASDIWAPVLSLRGAYAPEDSHFVLDNIEVRAPEAMADEILAARIESELRGRLKLNVLMERELDARDDLTVEVRELVRKYTQLGVLQDSERRRHLHQLLVGGTSDEETYFAVLGMLKDEVAEKQDDWEMQQLFAAAAYRSGDWETSLEALRQAERNHLRVNGESHPVHFALLSLISHAKSESERSLLALDRMRELLRSRHWSSHESTKKWKAVVDKQLPDTGRLRQHTAPLVAKLLESTYRALATAHVNHDFTVAEATFNPNGVVEIARDFGDAPASTTLSGSDWLSVQERVHRGPAPLHARMSRLPIDVRVDSGKAEFTYWLMLTDGKQFERWRCQDTLALQNSAWKVQAHRRFLTSAGKLGDSENHPTIDWALRDEAVIAARTAAESKNVSDGVAYVRALLNARRFPEAKEVAERLCRQASVPAEAWSMLCQAAIACGDLRTTEAAGIAAVKRDVNVDGPLYLRTVAIEQHLSEEPTTPQPNITVKNVTFFTEASTKDFLVPGNPIGAWFPTGSSALVMFVLNSEQRNGLSPDEYFENLLETFRANFHIQMYRDTQLTIGKLEGRELIIEGYGDGRSIRPSTTSNSGTIQHWILLRRNDEVIGALITATPAEFDQRNTEFEFWLRNHVTL